eukprot:scaffold5075_cov109-Isochrysis_galbana.AAC.11
MACLKSIAASKAPIVLVVRWMSEMPRKRKEASRPHRLLTTPPPSEMMHECLVIPILRISSIRRWNSPTVLDGSVDGSSASDQVGTSSSSTRAPDARRLFRTSSAKRSAQMLSETR